MDRIAFEREKINLAFGDQLAGLCPGEKRIVCDGLVIIVFNIRLELLDKRIMLCGLFGEMG